MLAARMYGANDLRVEEIPVPEVGDGEVLIKIKAAAVCGTDVRMLSFGASGIDESNPRVLGHEFAGIIDKVGVKGRVSSNSSCSFVKDVNVIGIFFAVEAVKELVYIAVLFGYDKLSVRLVEAVF